MVDRRHLIVGVAPVRIPGVRPDVLVATARGVGAPRRDSPSDRPVANRGRD